MLRVTEPVTMECAGNGRAFVHPRPVGQPWAHDAVSTAYWTGVRLRDVLEQANVSPEAVDIAFWGTDHGIERGYEHTYARSLAPAVAAQDGVLLAYEMNGAPVEPQHGAPLRLVVPGWYGMASVKWLTRIEAIDRPFDGYQQFPNYHYRQAPDEPGVPVTGIKVRALMVPPGFPDYVSRARVIEAGPTVLVGRAWSGLGSAVTRVEVAIDDVWRDARLGSQPGPYAWRAWRCEWQATPGEYELACRATDDGGSVQPLASYWTLGGMGNNFVQRIQVLVRPRTRIG
jgi:DMSO/TMAO reductase YedYZ molybdopterin-dependent catalytic subunit